MLPVDVGPLEGVSFLAVRVAFGEDGLDDLDAGDGFEFVSAVSDCESGPEIGGVSEGLGSSFLRAVVFGLLAMLA